MIILDKKLFIFNIKEVWFANSVYDLDGCSSVSFRRCKMHTDLPGFVFNEEVTYVIDLTQDLEQIWRNMKKSCRNSIRRSERDGIEIKQNHNFDEFYEIYKTHVNKTKYLKILENKSQLKAAGTLFTAEYDGETLVGHLHIEDQDHMVYYRGASKIIDDDKALRTIKGNASHLILWEAMKYAKAKGIKEFDMGGLATDSINKFKEGFGGKRVCYPAYNKHYNIFFNTAIYLGKKESEILSAKAFRGYQMENRESFHWSSVREFLKI